MNIQEVKNNTLEDSGIDSYLQRGSVFVVFVCTIIMLVISFATSCRQKTVFYRLMLINEHFLYRLGRKVSLKRFKTLYLIKLTVFILLYCASLYGFNILHENSSIIRYLNWVGFTIIRIAFSGKVFTFYIDLVNHYLEHLLPVVEDMMIEKHLPLKVMNPSPNRIIAVKSLPPSHNEIASEKLLAIKTIYGMLWETGSLINECTGNIMLIYVFLTVVTVTGAGYRIFLVIVSHQPLTDLIGKIR